MAVGPSSPPTPVLPCLGTEGVSGRQLQGCINQWKSRFGGKPLVPEVTNQPESHIYCLHSGPDIYCQLSWVTMGTWVPRLEEPGQEAGKAQPPAAWAGREDGWRWHLASPARGCWSPGWCASFLCQHTYMRRSQIPSATRDLIGQGARVTFTLWDMILLLSGEGI